MESRVGRNNQRKCARLGRRIPGLLPPLAPRRGRPGSCCAGHSCFFFSLAGAGIGGSGAQTNLFFPPQATAPRVSAWWLVWCP